MMNRFGIFSLLLAFLVLAFGVDAQAVSLSPELVERLRNEGRLEEWVQRAKVAREKGVWAPNPDPPIKRAKDGSIVTDTLKPVVICVDFDDNEHYYDAADFDTLLFSVGFVHPTGSMRDYYLENSYGKLDVVGGVTGWYRMPELYSYYVWGLNGTGPYPHNTQKLAEDALDAADPYVDFSEYDHDGDGWVDGFIVVHAGPGAEQTGSDDDIWSHKWQMLSVVVKDGVKFYTFNMDPETRSSGLVDMGVFAHEFGHSLGADDLYDYDNSSEGAGKWSIMAAGSWNNSGHTPAHFDAWHKYKVLGFTQVDTVTENRTGVEILQAETSPLCYRLWTGGSIWPYYFLVENRQRVGFDKYLPGDGLLIWHVDQNMSNNDYEWCPGNPANPHYKVALEQADGLFQLEGCYGSPNQGNAGDPFPGYYNQRAFNDTTNPGSRNYYDNSTQVAVWNISDSDSAMYADMDVNWSRPGLSLDEFILDDLLGGDGDGRPEGGETVKLYFTISNIWLPINGTEVTASADTAGIVFTDDYSYLGDIGTGGSANNNSDPIEFEVDPLFPGRPTIFTLHVEGNTASGTYVQDLEVEVWAGNAEILIVDDDSGSATDYQSYYTSALDSLRTIYDIWDTEGKGDPDFSFSLYKYLIWYTGDHKTDLFTQAQVESLMSFLDGGGRLFMTSQDAAEVLANSSDPLDSIFLTDYLHCSLDNGSVAERQVMGVDGDTIGDGWYMYLSGIPSPQNQTSRDALVPDDSADTVLNYAGSGWVRKDIVAGLRFQGDYKLVFFGFGFEGMNTAAEFQGQPLAPPHVVMQTVLDWLAAPWGYVYGDASGDGIVDIADVMYLINYLFLGGSAPDPMAAGDANGDCTVDTGDVLYLINYLFLGGSPPKEGCA